MIFICDYWWNWPTISEIWSFYSYFVVFMSRCCGKLDSGKSIWLENLKKSIACESAAVWHRVFIKPLFNRWHKTLHSSQKHACTLYTCVCDLSFMNSYLVPDADAVYCLSLYGKSKGSNLLYDVSQNDTYFPFCKIVFWAPTAAIQTNLAIEEMVIWMSDITNNGGDEQYTQLMLMILLHNVKTKVKHAVECVYSLQLPVTAPREDQTCPCVNSHQTKTKLALPFKCWQKLTKLVCTDLHWSSV